MKIRNFTLSIIFILAININNVLAQEAASAFNYKTEFDISYYNAGVTTLDKYKEERCKLDVYYPEGIQDFATIVWFHAGGLRSGERFIPEQLKNQDIAIVAVDYRLYPKVKSPAYIEDAAAAVAWVFNNIHNYGGSSELVFVSGHSAGGYLASMIGLDKRWLANYNINADSIAGLIPFSGHAITHFTIREEKGISGEQPIIDYLAPLFHVRADAPPLVLITGDRKLELLGRYEENAYLMRMMKVVGHKKTTLYELQGFDHGSMADPAFSILLKHVKTNAN
jgi:acetyl esterase/lipase